jgi:succinate dehydrogenase/fumarate reductase flavoprotein subunit
VTAGGISTAGLSSQTMEAKRVPGLYAIGEAVDVTGWLGGYNFQWAWASGWAAGQAISRSRVGHFEFERKGLLGDYPPIEKPNRVRCGQADRI